MKAALYLALALTVLSTQDIHPSNHDSTPLSNEGDWGFDLSGRNTTVWPGDDFYKYANGEWLKEARVPADRAVVGSFPDLRQESEEQVAALLGTVSQKDDSEQARKVRMLYRSFLNETAVERLGLEPLRSSLKALRSSKTKAEIARAMGNSFSGFGESLFQLDLAYDRKDPQHYAVYLSQGGLGLPGRDYYLSGSFSPPGQRTKATSQTYCEASSGRIQRTPRMTYLRSKGPSHKPAGLVPKCEISVVPTGPARCIP